MQTDPQGLARRAARKAGGILQRGWLRSLDRTRTTYSMDFPRSRAGLHRFFTSPLSGCGQAVSAAVCAVPHYLEHRFDVLGSGRRKVRHGMRCEGLEGRAYDFRDGVVPDGEGRWLRISDQA